jgi:hypothetical protein
MTGLEAGVVGLLPPRAACGACDAANINAFVFKSCKLGRWLPCLPCQRTVARLLLLQVLVKHVLSQSPADVPLSANN